MICWSFSRNPAGRTRKGFENEMTVTRESYFRAGKGVERRKGYFSVRKRKPSRLSDGARVPDRAPNVRLIHRKTGNLTARALDTIAKARIVCNLPSQGFSLNTSGLSFQCPPACCHRYPNLHSFTACYVRRDVSLRSIQQSAKNLTVLSNILHHAYQLV